MKAHKADELYHEKRFNWLLLILAILINCAMLFFLFLLNIDSHFWEFKKDSLEQPEAPVVFQEMPEAPQQPEPQPEIKPDEVAALKPGASHFGMPDEYNEDELSPAMPESEAEEQTKEEDQPEKPEEPSLEFIKKTEQIPDPISAHLEDAHELIQTQTAPPQIKQEKDQSHLLQEKTVEPKIAKREQQEQPPTQKVKAPIKKELTFNDLAQGFLASLDEGGNDLMERKGNENIRPDFEEMRYLSYLHKIIWHMQNEWHRDNSLMSCSVPVMVITGVSVSINKDGTLQKASVIQSCGNYQIDEAIIRGINTASPYPPLPAYLKKDVLTVEFGIKHIGGNSARNRANFHFR
jgi:TonB family protein